MSDIAHRDITSADVTTAAAERTDMSAKAAVAFVVAMFVAGVDAGSGSSVRADEATSSTYLPSYRCMMVTQNPSRGESGPPPVMASPRAGATELGPASDPTIVDNPPHVVNGYVRVLLLDGRSGWVRRSRLRNWTVAASPGLRCFLERTPDGRLQFGYAHPG